MFLLPPLRPIYGSIYVLIMAGVISGMPLAVQITKSNLLQLGAELEEASWLTGGSWWHTYRRVVLPLLGRRSSWWRLSASSARRVTLPR